MEETPTGADFMINNQNLEEAEELEERKRREEEIHNLLSHKLEDFNFDDQSTLNSSIDSQHADEAELQGGFDEQYRKAEPQDQLKVLYEVRCQEIAVSNSEVEKLQMELGEQEQQLKKKILLLEYENDCKNVSLKEAQRLLADKTENIKTMAAQIAKLENAAKSYESNIAEIKEEGDVLREINIKYERDLVLLERGFPLKAGVADKEVHEALRAKVAQLESSLQTTSEEKDHMESQLKRTVKELRQYIHEQEKILNQKDVQLFTLNENYNSIQQQHQELQKTVEEMKRAKATGSPLQEELRKIRENNDQAERFGENVRTILSEQFKPQLESLQSENLRLKDEIRAKDSEVQELKLHLENRDAEFETKYKAILKETGSALENMKDKEIAKLNEKLTLGTKAEETLKAQIKELENKIEKIHVHRDDQIRILKAERENLLKIIYHLKQDYDLTMRLKRDESAELEDRLKDLQKHVSSKANTVMVDEVVQVSLGMDQKERDHFKKVQENLYNRLMDMFRAMDRLQHKLVTLSQQNALLKERERQIKCLQEKAARLEKLLLQKHGRLTSSDGINTDHQEPHEDASVLKIKYETLKLQTEARIRKELQQEFDVKLEKVMSRTAEELRHQYCVKCPELELEMKKLHEMRKEDRISLVRMVEMWRDKFSQLEDDLQARDEQCSNTIYGERLMEQKFKEKLIKVTQQMEEKAANDLENKKDEILQISLQRHNRLCTKLQKIKLKLDQIDSLPLTSPPPVEQD